MRDDKLEAEMIARLRALDTRSWISRNWFSLLSTSVMILALGVGWGTTREQIRVLQEQRSEQIQQFHQAIVLLNSQLSEVNRKIDAHQIDRTVHVDSAVVMNQLAELRSFMLQMLNTLRDQRRVGEPR